MVKDGTQEIIDIRNKIKADTILFFDMDGTLIETNFANFLAYQHAIISVTNLDTKLSYDKDQRFNRSLLRTSIPNLTETEYESIIKRKDKYYFAIMNETKLNTAIVDILIKYSRTNKSILVTKCRCDRAMATLKHFGLAKYFTSIFCRELSDGNRKINKYENAIYKLKIPPKSVIAFENEQNEIEDAKIAGIQEIIKIKYL